MTANPTSHPLSEPLRDPTLVSLAAALGWDTSHAHPMPTEALGAWGLEPRLIAQASLSMLGAHGPHRLILVERMADAQAMRKLAIDSYHFNRARVLVWCFTHGDELTFAIPDHPPGHPPLMRSLTIRRDEPSYSDLDKLQALSWSQLVEDPLRESGELLREHWRRVLHQGSLTSHFYRRFLATHAKLAQLCVNGPAKLQDRRLIAMTVMLRLVVLCFLERSGALDHDPRYLKRRLADCRLHHRDFYRELLYPLCFGALNCPPQQRAAHIPALGQLPFLNGGLFEPSPLELSHPELTWPMECWGELIDDFLDSYRFSLFEPHEHDQPWTISPEVLGRVFESLMWPERRKANGAFYSPPALVSQLVSQALSAHLERAAGLSADQAHELLQGDAQALDHHERRLAADALSTLRILDPAVGTGAFLVEALSQLMRANQALEVHKHHDQTRWQWISGLIHQHLHGVDIDPTAVRLCEVRIWLMVLAHGLGPHAEPSQIEPLPNLQHRLAQGDSLISVWSMLNIRPPQPQDAPWHKPDGWDEQVTRYEQLNQRYLSCHGEEKLGLNRARGEAERQLALTLTTHHQRRLSAQLGAARQASSSPDLFGQRPTTSTSLRAHISELERQVRDLDALIEQLTQDQRCAMTFSYTLRFAQVMAQGGFNMILTNPPWVRATKQAAYAKPLYAQRYLCAASALWPCAAEQGVQTTFGAQVDLSAMFIERSLELLTPGGVLAVLFPSKLLRSLQGAGLRQLLMDQHLLYLEDRADADEEIFDAVTYPAALILRRRRGGLALSANAPDDDDQAALFGDPALDPGYEPSFASISLDELDAQRQDVEIVCWDGPLPLRWSQPQETLSLGDHPAYPWILSPPQELQPLRELWHRHSPLGSFEALRPRRGVMTGKNDAFVLDAWVVRRMLGPAADQHSRPVLMGRDIEQGGGRAERRILWAYDEQLNLRQRLPAQLQAHFESWRDALEQRSDHNAHRPLWQLFRVQDGLQRPKVVWADMGQRLNITLAGALVIPLNTTYYIPFMDEVRAWVMAQALAHPIAQRFCHLCAERARGGWRRHFAWVISLIPLPERLGRWLSQQQRDPHLDALFATLFNLQDQAQALHVIQRLYDNQPPEPTREIAPPTTH